MREIDDRYPEFARPYEPVKGGKHHGPLRGSPFMLAAAALMILMLGLSPPARKPASPAPAAPSASEVPAARPTPAVCLRWPICRRVQAYSIWARAAARQ